MKPKNLSMPDWKILQKKYPNNIENILQKIANGYPVQYLIGNVEFLNTIIDVDQRALIPRFETEFLVDKTIKYARKIFQKKIEIIDLGTGSGCIAISLKKNLDCNVTALDISQNALDLARANATKNKQKITFINQDMLLELPANYDILISNPPYIPQGGFVDDSVFKYEPHLALFAEDNGLYFYKIILQKHILKINKPGLIAFEIGENQVSDLKSILNSLNIKNYKFENDFTNKPRYLFIFNE